MLATSLCLGRTLREALTQNDLVSPWGNSALLASRRLQELQAKAERAMQEAQATTQSLEALSLNGRMAPLLISQATVAQQSTTSVLMPAVEVLKAIDQRLVQVPGILAGMQKAAAFTAGAVGEIEVLVSCVEASGRESSRPLLFDCLQGALRGAAWGSCLVARQNTNASQVATGIAVGMLAGIVSAAVGSQLGWAAQQMGKYLGCSPRTMQIGLGTTALLAKSGVCETFIGPVLGGVIAAEIADAIQR